MDCIEGMKLIPDWSIDCIITDPPYWTTACKRDNIIPFEPMREQLKRIIKPNGAIVLFGSEPFSSALRMSNIKQYKYDWIWEKTRKVWHMLAKKQPMTNHELISTFYSAQPIYNPQWVKECSIIKRNTEWRKNSNIYWKTPQQEEHQQNLTWYPTKILKFSSEHNVWKHPTQKPVALIEYLIKTYTNEWGIVLDFTAGSFTTCVAADNTNRKWIWIEKDLDYCKIWKERIIKNRIEKWLDLLDFTSNI